MISVINLVRAFLKKSDFICLDEATANLDQIYIEKTLEIINQMTDKTLIYRVRSKRNITILLQTPFISLTNLKPWKISIPFTSLNPVKSCNKVKTIPNFKETITNWLKNNPGLSTDSWTKTKYSIRAQKMVEILVFSPRL